MNTYNTDFYSWTQQQAALLRQGCLAELDTINLIEEIEDMARSERRALESRLAVLLAHLLKWMYQPTQQSNSCRATIKEQRRRIARIMRQNPSLKPEVSEFLDDAYGDAIQIAVKETNMDEAIFPTNCPWILAQILDDAFWPQ